MVQLTALVLYSLPEQARFAADVIKTEMHLEPEDVVISLTTKEADMQLDVTS